MAQLIPNDPTLTNYNKRANNLKISENYSRMSAPFAQFRDAVCDWRKSESADIIKANGPEFAQYLESMRDAAYATGLLIKERVRARETARAWVARARAYHAMTPGRAIVDENLRNLVREAEGEVYRCQSEIDSTVEAVKHFFESKGVDYRQALQLWHWRFYESAFDSCDAGLHLNLGSGPAARNQTYELTLDMLADAWGESRDSMQTIDFRLPAIFGGE